MKNRTLIILITLIIPFAAGAQETNINGKYIGNPKLYYGVAYYPEVWNLEGIDEDIEMMKRTNINVVRMAEFAWSMMEPEEGQFEFEWLHLIIEKLHANGIDVILGTPTATPPVWAAEKYPGIFIMNADGSQRQHGARRNCSYTSPDYQRLSKIIVEAMAREFGKKPGVIAWQTDNEFNLIYDYSEHTRKLWHQWLQEKYGTIENLNQIWHTNLWSQRYQRFDQIPLPHPDIWHHTSLRFDWDRFSNQQIVDYQKIHLDAIRSHSSIPITHDGMPGQNKDYPAIFEDLDFMGVNCYHSFPVYPRVQTNFDRMRGYGKGMHWYLETAPNHSGGGQKGNTWFIHQPQGAMRANIWMNIAMGGQGSLFWLWRQQPAGQEMPHGAVISAWGQPAANFDDIQFVGEEMKKYSDLMITHPVEKPEIAIYYSHTSDMGLRIEEWSNGIRYYPDWAEMFYSPISDAFLHRDVIHENGPIDDYKVLVAPLMPIISKELSDRLHEWVKDGGTLILGPMSAYRNEYWAAHTHLALGWMEEWTGIGVESRLPVDTYNKDYDVVPTIEFGTDDTLPLQGDVTLWSEALFAQNGIVLATYTNGMQQGKPAIVENQVGNGKVVMLGTYPGSDAFGQIVMKYAADQQIVPMAVGGSEGVLMVPRINALGEKLMVVINLINQPSSITLPGKNYHNILKSDDISSSDIYLEPFGVMILRER